MQKCYWKQSGRSGGPGAGASARFLNGFPGRGATFFLRENTTSVTCGGIGGV